VRSKIERLIDAMKTNDWHGELDDSDEDIGILYLWATRGDERVDIWFDDNQRLAQPAEYHKGSETTLERSSAAIRQRIEAAPAGGSRLRKDKSVKFRPDDDDATILDGLTGKTVVCRSLIADDFPPTTHRVLFDRLHQPTVKRFEDGRVNVDYVDETGFHSLRVNEIVKVK
jgi:hypothetical protein